MFETIREACKNLWMGRYLRLLSLLYGYGAYVHLGNIFGFGEMPFFQVPLAWKTADISYAVIDIFAAVWLFRRSPAGVILFLFAALSQLVIYLLFPHIFILTTHHHRAVDLLVIVHVVTLGLFVYLLVSKK
jgi:hypothetical protein